jgi:hypothetical protein
MTGGPAVKNLNGAKYRMKIGCESFLPQIYCVIRMDPHKGENSDGIIQI